MKYYSIIFKKKPQLMIFFIFSLITLKIYCEDTLDNKIKNICLKAESSVKSYFEEKQELPENFQNFELKEEIPENRIKSAIKLLLFDEETINNYLETKTKEKQFIQIIVTIIVILLIIVTLDFEIHFFFRLFCRKNIFEPSFINFYKISPFYWILYFILNKEKANNFYSKFLNKHMNKKNKYILFTFIFIMFAVVIVIYIITLLNSKEYDNSSQVTINVFCTSLKVLNEIQNGKQILKNGSHLIGFKDINSFIYELMENKIIFKNYFNNYTEAYNEVNNDYNEWENYLNGIQKNLSDKNSSKYFFYNYPSDPDFIKMFCNFTEPNKCKKSLYQTQFIYNYYPYDDDTKTLWKFNQNLQKNKDTILENFKIFEHFFIDPENLFNFYFEKYNVKNGFSKIDSILNIAIQELLEIIKKNILNKFINSYLSDTYSFDFILLIFLGINTLLALMYIEYYCVKKYYFGRVIISVVFYNIIFFILCINFIEFDKLQKINITFSYIKEISKGIYYILNGEIKNYGDLFNEKNNTHFKNISLIMRFKDAEMNNNLFNYIIYYINNEDKLKNFLNDKILYLNKNQLKTINNTLNDIIDNKIDSTSLNYQISNFSKEILKFKNEGLKHSTNFVDFTSTGFLDSYLESPLTYLTYVNIRTRKTIRKDFGFNDILCDETWNISTSDFYECKYKYKPRDFVLCDNCINTCSTDKKILLNFMEYTIDEIEQRYNNLKDGINNDIYYELMYYFNATDKLRDKIIFEQLESLYEINENLNKIQNNIFNSIKKMGYIAKQIIKIYENILNKYEKEDVIFNYNEFIKDDLYYLIGQIEINFSQKISKEYKSHLNINIVCILTCFILIIFYILFAKEMKYYKKDIENEEDILSIEKNVNSPHHVIKNSIKIDQINVGERKQGNPGLMNIINTYIINDGKHTKINKNLINNNSLINYIDKGTKASENPKDKNVGLMDAKKILVNCESKKSAMSSSEIDESRNDESKICLTKGKIIENKKRNVFDKINKDIQQRLKTENKVIRNKK